MADEDGFADKGVPMARMLSWARNSAAYRLSRRMMTERELADAIRRKARQKFEGVTAEQLAELAAAAIAHGHLMHALDDNSYAQIKVRSAMRSGRSRRATAHRLGEKGIDRETIELALAEADDLYSALIFARKRGIGPFRRIPPDEKSRARELSAFARNGFGFEIGRAVLEMDREAAETVLAGQDAATDRLA